MDIGKVPDSGIPLQRSEPREQKKQGTKRRSEEDTRRIPIKKIAEAIEPKGSEKVSSLKGGIKKGKGKKRKDESEDTLIKKRQRVEMPARSLASGIQVKQNLERSGESYLNLFNLLAACVKDGNDHKSQEIVDEILGNIQQDEFAYIVLSKFLGDNKILDELIQNRQIYLFPYEKFLIHFVGNTDVGGVFKFIDEMKISGIQLEEIDENDNFSTLKQNLIQSVQIQKVKNELSAIIEDYNELNFDKLWEQHQAVLGGYEGIKEWNDPLTEQINRTSLFKIEIEKLQTNNRFPKNEKDALLKTLGEISNGLTILQEALESRLRKEISKQKSSWSEDVQQGVEVPQVENQSFANRVDILNKCSIEGYEKDLIISFANRFLSLNPKAHTFQVPQNVGTFMFTGHEIQQLSNCISILERYQPKPEEELAVGSFLQDLRIGMAEIKSAHERCNAKFNNQEEIMRISSLLDSIIDSGGVNLSRLEEGAKVGEIINLLSDYYWTYSPPFGIKIYPEQLTHFMSEDQASRFVANLGKVISLETYQQLSKKDLEEVQVHTLERLNDYRITNKAKWRHNSPRVNIVGGGPGGLARGIVAATLGANWQVIEMREREAEGWVRGARKNVIKIDTPETIQFLLFSGTVEALLLDDKIAIKKSTRGEYSFTTTIGSIEETMTKALRSMIDDDGGMVSGRAVDVRTGLNSADILVTEVIVKGEDQPEEMGSDIVVLADGAGGIASKVFGDTRETLSSQTTLFAVNLENCHVVEKGKGRSFTPPEGQIKFDFTSIEGMLGTNAYATLLVSPESSEVIKTRQKEIAEINDPEERQEAEKALNQWYLDSSVSYMEWLGYKTSNPGNESLARPFSVTITKAKNPAKMEGDALILRTGDAFATPDPLGSIGLATAVATSMQFSDILTSRLHGKSTSLTCEEYNYASGKAYDNLVSSSFSSRSTIDVGKTTPLHTLQQFLKRNEMEHNMANGLSIAFQKHQSGGALSKEDIDWLVKAEVYLKQLNLPEDDIYAKIYGGYRGTESLLKLINEMRSPSPS